MPPTRRYVKKPLKLAAIFIVTAIVFIVMRLYVLNLFDHTDCQRYNYNDKLNGGVKEINGEIYTIDICGSGVNNSHFLGDSWDMVQLTISNEQGEVLAKRRYKVFWDGVPGHEPITVEKNSIIYQDDEKQQDYTITMPPTLIDWITARIF